MLIQCCRQSLGRLLISTLRQIDLGMIFVLCVLLSIRSVPLRAEDPAAPDLSPAIEITKDTTLDPRKTYGRLIIKASNIRIDTLDGRGVRIVGATKGSPKAFKGTGILAEGVSNVTLKDVTVSGFETGLKVVDGKGWQIEGCDFSDNFHDPEFGWGEQGRRGGIVLERVTKSTIKKCKANRVWDACSLVNSSENYIYDNDFSKTSNTCLKLWTSCGNSITRNNLSYGIRISPGEVHARDSTCVLIESGSNDNEFLNNDCRFGGDGIFVRVLNGWVSTGNDFAGNDCSYANNNGVECWAPRNSFSKNKANHCSYGFWMGGSDQTQLIENEASFNGDPKGHHNSPHLPKNGHAGIVFMFGPGSHCIARSNVCEHNNGAGIAIIGDIASKGAKWKAFHWIVEQNKLTENRWGIYLQHADWITVGMNDLRSNQVAELLDDGGVRRLDYVPLPGNIKLADFGGLGLPRVPIATLQGPASATVGEEIVFNAAKSDAGSSGTHLNYRWDLGDGTLASTPEVRHSFRDPGFFRLGLTVSNSHLSDLAWRDFYVVEALPELATEGHAAEWGMAEEPNLKITYRDVRDTKLTGSTSVYAMIDPYHGQRASLLFPKSKAANWSLAGKTHLVFWLKMINPNLGWQDVNPVITLYGADKTLKLTPKKNLLGSPAYNEGREGWNYFEIPLAGDELWQRDGVDITTLNYLTVGVDSWDAQPLQLWIDGLAFKAK